MRVLETDYLVVGAGASLAGCRGPVPLQARDGVGADEPSAHVIES
jgi:hypothetical protein